MERYLMSKPLDVQNINNCLKNYEMDYFSIKSLNEKSPEKYLLSRDLINSNLNIFEDQLGIHFLINNEEIFKTGLDEYKDGFSLMYERSFHGGRPYFIENDRPYNSLLPEPRRTCLKNTINNNLIEIYFNGRVNIAPHLWMDRQHWKFWKVITN